MPPSPRRRRLLFTTATVVAVLLLLEAAAWGVELAVTPERLYPDPSPLEEQQVRELSARAHGMAQQPWSGEVRLVEAPGALRWRLPPGQRDSWNGPRERTNSLGLRGAELPPRQAGELRLLSLGDSSVYGFGVLEDEVFSQLAAATLAQSLVVPVTGVNGGVPGYDSGQALALLQQLGDRIDPDVIVVACLWSDLYPRGPDAVAAVAALEEARGPLRRLASYRLLRRLLSPLLRSRHVRYLRSMDQLEAERNSRVPVASYAANLEAMAAWARQRQVQVVYVMLPAPVDLEQGSPPETIQVYREALRQVAAEQEAPLVDGPLIFRQAGANLGCFEDNVHPAAAGHYLLALGLVDALQELDPSLIQVPAAPPAQPE